MMTNGHVLVIGSAGTDVKARLMPDKPLEWGASNRGSVRNSVGGAARNVAENLARLEVPTILLTALGEDSAGRRVLRRCEKSGIDISYIRQIGGARTGSYVALMQPDGELLLAISDFEILREVDADFLLQNESLFQDAAMVALDMNLSDEALETAFHLAGRYGVRIYGDPTTPELAARLAPYIPQLYLVTPNGAETPTLIGGAEPIAQDAARQAAHQLVKMGATIAVVTLGDQGLAYAEGSGGGYIRAINTEVVDSTGAGDAFTGAVIFGLLNEVPVDEAMRLGVTAASLTLQSRETVLPELSQELLYDKLRT